MHPALQTCAHEVIHTFKVSKNGCTHLKKRAPGGPCLWDQCHLPISLRIDKGSPGAAALLGTYIHHYGSYVGILYTL